MRKTYHPGLSPSKQHGKTLWDFCVVSWRGIRSSEHSRRKANTTLRLPSFSHLNTIFLLNFWTIMRKTYHPCLSPCMQHEETLWNLCVVSWRDIRPSKPSRREANTILRQRLVVSLINLTYYFFNSWFAYNLLVFI